VIGLFKTALSLVDHLSLVEPIRSLRGYDISDVVTLVAKTPKEPILVTEVHQPLVQEAFEPPLDDLKSVQLRGMERISTHCYEEADDASVQRDLSRVQPT
jgi:hypothetical protein